MSRIQNSEEVGGWDVWVTPAGANSGAKEADYFVATCSTLAEACIELLNAVAKEEKDALREAAVKIAELEEGTVQRVLGEALIKAVRRCAKGGGSDD